MSDPSSLRRAEKMLERHRVTLETLNTATLKGAAWLLGYATRNAPVGNGALRAAAFATIRRTLFECCAEHLNTPLTDVTKSMFISLVPRLTTAYIIAVNDAFDLNDRVNVNEAIAADYLVDVPPSFTSGEKFTIHGRSAILGTAQARLLWCICSRHAQPAFTARARLVRAVDQARLSGFGKEAGQGSG